jgi:hypothetical protein
MASHAQLSEKLYRYFNDIRVRGFVLNGAPLPCKTANVWTSILVPSDYFLQGCLLPNNPDRVIIDLDPVHNRLDVGLPEGDWPRRDVLPHDLPNALDGLGIEGVQLWMNVDPGERLLGPISIGFERRDPVFQDIVSRSVRSFSTMV